MRVPTANTGDTIHGVSIHRNRLLSTGPVRRGECSGLRVVRGAEYVEPGGEGSACFTATSTGRSERQRANGCGVPWAAMSLQFSRDTLSKREKQEIFKKSLDDQLQMNRDACAGLRKQDSALGNAYGVPRLQGFGPELHRIPGLDINHQQSDVGNGCTPRYENSPYPHERQPYMSALSEMNGRPLHVRQQQFQKETQYRNMLKEQIEQNRRRKESERAKLDEEKKRELQEIQRLQGRSAPRRQQHAQFQESPDLPMPSPGRLPPARDLNQQRKHDTHGDDGNVCVAPTHGSLPTPRWMDPGWNDGIEFRKGMGSRRNGPQDRPRHEEGSGQEYRRLVDTQSQQERTIGVDARGNAAERRKDFREDRRIAAGYRRDDGLPLEDGHRRESQSPVDDRPRTEHVTLPRGEQRQSFGDESVARKLKFERDDEEDLQREDVVPRADFDELSSLCRELLMEQKVLRRKLEDREERELLAERARQEDRPKPRPDRTSNSAGKPSYARAPAPAASGDGRRRPHAMPGSGARAQGRTGGVRGNMFGGDRTTKPRVAFGSSMSRMGQPQTVARPMSRSGGEARVSKSEPVSRTEERGHHHMSNVASRSGHSGHSKPQSRRKSFEFERNITTKGTVGGQGGEEGSSHRARGNWTSWRDEEGTRDTFDNRRTDPTNGIDSDITGTIHGLLARRRDAVRDLAVGQSGQDAVATNREQEGSGELGGESTFLAAHELKFGLGDGRGKEMERF